MLGGKGYLPKSLIGGFAFVYDPPAAVAPDQLNRSEAINADPRGLRGRHVGVVQELPPEHAYYVAYPGNDQPASPDGQRRQDSAPSRRTTTIKYIKTGDLSGLANTSYLSLVPFEEGTADYAALKTHAKSDDSWLAGPDTYGSQVMCLTCHRAHASGWDGIMRWNAETNFIVNNGFYAQEGQPTALRPGTHGSRGNAGVL